MSRRGSLALLALPTLLWLNSSQANPLQPRDFAWRAQLEIPTGASLVRVALPPQALIQLQSSDAYDLRIFNGAGKSVPFAFTELPTAAPAVQLTPSYRAHRLHSQIPSEGSIQVHISEIDQSRSIWVQLDGTNSDATPTPLNSLNSAIFDTRGEKKAIKALMVQAELPANVPIKITAATSADLAQWTPVTLHGRLYRFEGNESFANDTLTLEQPLQLEGRYLRLDWEGHDNVSIAAITGSVIVANAPERVIAALPTATAVSNTALEWRINFSTPISALTLTTQQSNSLLPVRILGRNDASLPWRLLGQTAVYRLGTGTGETTNPPATLHGASVRWLRVEASNGMEFGQQILNAAVEFIPVQLVFLASGNGPFELAVGRTNTEAAHLSANILTMAAQNRLEDIPQALLGTETVRQHSAPSFLPNGTFSRTLWLWAVLVGGVLLLAAIAWSLLGQLKSSAPKPPTG